MFLRLAPTSANKNDSIQKYVEKVKFDLHPSFGVTELSVKSVPYEMKRVGWGTFEIPVTIYFRRDTGRREPLKLEHMLSFEGKGKYQTISVSFDKDKLAQLKV